MSRIYFEMSWEGNGVLIYFFELEATLFGYSTKDHRPVVLAEALAFFWQENGQFWNIIYLRAIDFICLIKTQMCLYSRDITFWDC